jgi:hypothetical protein
VQDYSKLTVVTEEQAKAHFFGRCRVKGGWKCLCCGEGGASVQRQNTAYCHDLGNWTCLCEPCAKENSEHWRDMWTDYYSAIL